MYIVLGWIEKFIHRFNPDYKMKHFADDCFGYTMLAVFGYIILQTWEATLILVLLWILWALYFDS